MVEVGVVIINLIVSFYSFWKLSSKQISPNSQGLFCTERKQNAGIQQMFRSGWAVDHRKQKQLMYQSLETHPHLSENKEEDMSHDAVERCV